MDREEIENQLERLQRLFECYLKMGEQIANHPDWRMNIEFVEDLEQTLERRRSELLKKRRRIKRQIEKGRLIITSRAPNKIPRLTCYSPIR